MTPLSENVMQKIGREHLVPAAPWRFRFLRLIGWAALFVSTILASLFTAFAVHIISELDWEAFGHLGLTWYRAVLVSLPFLWFALVALFLIAAVVFGRLTRHGYRYQYWMLLLVFLGVAIVGGTVFEHTRFDEPIERLFLGSFSKQDALRPYIPDPEKQWAQPENGLLGGQVTAVHPDSSVLELKDQKEHDWQVQYGNATIEKNVDIEPEARVNIIGKQRDKEHFDADIVRPPKNMEVRTHADDNERTPSGEQEGADGDD